MCVYKLFERIWNGIEQERVGAKLMPCPYGYYMEIGTLIRNQLSSPSKLRCSWRHNWL
jgi:hypothetical protein